MTAHELTELQRLLAMVLVPACNFTADEHGTITGVFHGEIIGGRSISATTHLDGAPTADQVARAALHLAVSLFEHELEERLRFNGERWFNPHTADGPAFKVAAVR